MVTTRSQHETSALKEEYISPEPELRDPDYQSENSKSSKRRRITQVTPDPISRNEGNDGHDEDGVKSKTPTRKTQRELPTRNKGEDHFRSRSHFEIVIPVKDFVKMESGNASAEKQQITTKKKDSAGDNTTLAIGSPKEEVPLTKSEDPNKPTSQIKEDEYTPPGMSDKQAKAREKFPGSDEMSTSNSLPTTTMINSEKPKHKRFGSEDLSIPELDNIPEETHQQLQDADDSSDNDAPEVVARPDAQEKARNSVKKAAKAIEERDAIIRQRRKVQDVRLKTQAKAAGMKRKRNDNVDKEESKSDLIASLADPLSKKSRPQLPQFLPLEYLDDDISSSAIAPEIPIVIQNRIRGKKTKFSDFMPKKPKDLVRGSTTYKVAEAKGDGLLAPKADNTARSIKEAWQRGRVGKSGRNVRRPMNKGFLIKK